MDFKIGFLGKPQQLKQEKPDSAAAKQKVRIIEPNKDAKPKENDEGGDKDDDESSEDEVMKLVPLFFLHIYTCKMS